MLGSPYTAITEPHADTQVQVGASHHPAKHISQITKVRTVLMVGVALRMAHTKRTSRSFQGSHCFCTLQDSVGHITKAQVFPGFSLPVARDSIHQQG